MGIGTGGHNRRQCLACTAISWGRSQRCQTLPGEASTTGLPQKHGHTNQPGLSHTTGCRHQARPSQYRAAGLEQTCDQCCQPPPPPLLSEFLSDPGPALPLMPQSGGQSFSQKDQPGPGIRAFPDSEFMCTAPEHNRVLPLLNLQSTSYVGQDTSHQEFCPVLQASGRGLADRGLPGQEYRPPTEGLWGRD